MQTPPELMRGQGRSKHISRTLTSDIYRLKDHIKPKQSSDPPEMYVTSHDHLVLRATVNRVGFAGRMNRRSLSRRRQKPAPRAIAIAWHDIALWCVLAKTGLLDCEAYMTISRQERLGDKLVLSLLLRVDL